MCALRMMDGSDKFVCLTDVPEVGDGVPDAVEKDESAGDFVEVNEPVQRKQDVQAELPQLGDGMPEHGHEHEHRREIQTLTWARKNKRGVSLLFT